MPLMHLGVCICVCVPRSVAEVPVWLEFDCSVLEEAEKLQAEELVLNDLTVEGLQHR